VLKNINVLVLKLRDLAPSGGGGATENAGPEFGGPKVMNELKNENAG